LSATTARSSACSTEAQSCASRPAASSTSRSAPTTSPTSRLGGEGSFSFFTVSRPDSSLCFSLPRPSPTLSQPRPSPSLPSLLPILSPAVQVILGPNAIIAGLQFIVTNGISGTSTSTYCGTKNGLSAYIGRAGKAVGALGGICSTGSTTGRRRLAQSSNATAPGLVGGTFTTIVTPTPQGSNNSPPFSPGTTFTIDGKTVTGGNVTNGTASGRRLRMHRAMLAASLEN